MLFFFFSSRRRHTRSLRDWSSDVCSSDLQVAEAMVRAVRETRSAPLSGSPIDLAVVTGDATDNCQRNELRAYIDLLDGGRVRPDSGDPERYEGVAGPGVEDER